MSEKELADIIAQYFKQFSCRIGWDDSPTSQYDVVRKVGAETYFIGNCLTLARRILKKMKGV